MFFLCGHLFFFRLCSMYFFIFQFPLRLFLLMLPNRYLIFLLFSFFFHFYFKRRSIFSPLRILSFSFSALNSTIFIINSDFVCISLTLTFSVSFFISSFRSGFWIACYLAIKKKHCRHFYLYSVICDRCPRIKEELDQKNDRRLGHWFKEKKNQPGFRQIHG